MNKRFPANEVERRKYMIDLYQLLHPELKVDQNTKINNTPIHILCAKDFGPGIVDIKKKGPYRRVIESLEDDYFVGRKLDTESTAPTTSIIRDVKFSGIKDTYKEGATRDSREGKGRYDLISPFFLKRLARVLEIGAKNHGDNNWQKGIPYSRLIDSSLRHISQFNEGLRDEDHIVQAVCNLMFLIHFEEAGRNDLNDLQTNQKNK